jgi:hypothetical protein
MNKPAAFRASFSDFKLVKTRKMAQLIFEVPLEAVDEAYKVLGGMPNPSEERWFAIAPLKTEPEVTREKKSWNDLLPSAQAAIRCEEPTFRAFVREMHREHHSDDIAQSVRDLCEVNSRKDLNTNHQARVLWTQLDNQYQAWKAAEHA